MDFDPNEFAKFKGGGYKPGATSFNEGEFQSGIRATPWFKEYVNQYGEEPDLNTKDYDYRSAWKAGARPDVRDPTDGNRYHWPSEFKGDGHPNRFVNGVDTKTGAAAFNADEFDTFKKGSSSAPRAAPDGSSVPAFIADIPSEIGKAFKSGVQNLTRGSIEGEPGYDPRPAGEQGTLERLGKTGKQILAPVEMLTAIPVGIGRSVLGHGLAAVEDAGREFSGMPADPEGSFERGKQGADLAMAAGRAPSPRPALAPKPLTQGQEAALAADRVGVDLPRAVTSDSFSSRWAGKVASNVPIAGTPLRRASENAIEQMDDAMSAARSGYGSANPAEAGQVVREGVTEAIKSGPIKQKVDALYTDVDTLVNPTTVGPLTNTRRIANEIESRRTTSALPGSKKVDELDEALKRGGLTYEGIKGLRSHFGEMLHGAKEIPQGMAMGEVKQIYGALSDDMRLTIARAGGPDGLAAYEKAEKAAKRWANVREDLQRILDVKNEEGIFGRIVQAASSKTSADIQLLGRVRGAVGPDKWNEVTAALIEKLGRAPDGTFSPDRLLGPSGLGGLSAEGKRMLFRSTGGQYSSHADVIDDIATISQRWKSLNQFANPSGTGQTVIGFGGGIGAIADPVSTIGGFVGAAALAKILATPASARSLAAWSRAYQRAATNPTGPSIEGLRRATALFATNASRNAGVAAESLTNNVDALVRNMKNVVPAGANEVAPVTDDEFGSQSRRESAISAEDEPDAMERFSRWIDGGKTYAQRRFRNAHRATNWTGGPELTGRLQGHEAKEISRAVRKDLRERE